MGIEAVCGGCGRPIGANQFTSIIAGYCVQCSANTQLAEQLKQCQPMPMPMQSTEKEVFGETLREVPLIEVDK